jgi:large subunit ribosomal protein L24
MKKIHIKKDDVVVAIAGKERFAKKRGRVLKVFPSQGKAIVEGFNMLKKTMRPTQKNPKGGIVEKEGPVNFSNLMVYCPGCKKGVRVGWRRLADNSKVRYCKKCEEVLGKA